MDKATAIGGGLTPRIRDGYGAGEAARTAAGNGGRSGVRRKSDEVSLSPEGRELAAILRALSEVPDVREDRVAHLKDLLARGKFSANAVSLAERLIERGGLR